MVVFLQCNYGIWLWKTGLTSTAALPLLHDMKPNLCCEEKHVSLLGYVQHLHSSYKIVNWGWRVGRRPSGKLGYILVGCCIRWQVNWLVLIILSCRLARVVIWLLVCLLTGRYVQRGRGGHYCCANTKIGNPGPVCGPSWAVLLQCTGSSESAHSQDLFRKCVVQLTGLNHGRKLSSIYQLVNREQLFLQAAGFERWDLARLPTTACLLHDYCQLQMWRSAREAAVISTQQRQLGLSRRSFCWSVDEQGI